MSASAAVEAMLPEGSSRTMLRQLRPSDDRLADSDERLRFALLLAHACVLAEGRSSGCVGMSTAIVVAWHAFPAWYIAHVGDCRAYTLEPPTLRLLTQDHSLSTALTGLRGLPSRVEKSPFLRSRLTQVIGGEQAPTPDIQELNPAEGSRLLLCTDGVWGSLSEKELLSHLRAGAPAESICRTLVTAALDAGSRDNATALVACF